MTVDVHSRDVVEKLIRDNVTDAAEFSWTSQMRSISISSVSEHPISTFQFFRYYWVDKTVKLKMIHTTLDYGFEYLGNTGRLVITPLTDRYESE